MSEKRGQRMDSERRSSKKEKRSRSMGIYIQLIYLNIYNIYNIYTSTRARSGKTGGIPVFALVDLKKNRDFMRLKQDIDASI